MVLKLLGGLLLIVSCGKQVSIDHTALEEASKLQTKSAKTFQDGAISKMSNTNKYLVYNNSSYKISETSSRLSKEFIEKLPTGKTEVTFKANFLGEEVAIQEISRK